MAVVRPFVAFRPPAGLAHRVASPLHDWVDATRGKTLREAHPMTFVRVSHPELEDEGVAGDVGLKHGRSRRMLQAFLEEGWLEEEVKAGFFIYAQTVGGRTQVGLVALASVDEYERGDIRRHEQTQAAREDERTRYLEAVGGHDEPVLLTYRARAEIDARIAAISHGPSEVAFIAEDGVAHALWRVRGEDIPLLEEAFRRVPRLYIADGHHRSAASARLRAQRGPGGPEDWTLAVLVPDDQLRILPFHRAVRDLGEHTPASFLEALATRFTLSRTEEGPTPGPGRVAMLLEGAWWSLTPKLPVERADELDVNLLQDALLAPLLGICDPRRDPRIDFIGGPAGLSRMEARVRAGEFAVGFALHPTDVRHVLAVCDRGELMPPQSTCFEPKLRAGLILYLFRGATAERASAA